MILLRGKRLELPLYSFHFTSESDGEADDEFWACSECTHCHKRMNAYALPSPEIIRWEGMTLSDVLAQVYPEVEDE